jgi:hypothetical protein
MYDPETRTYLGEDDDQTTPQNTPAPATDSTPGQAVNLKKLLPYLGIVALVLWGPKLLKKRK